MNGSFPGMTAGRAGWWVVSLMVLVTVLAGCGRKTTPKSMSEEVPPKIQDLAGVVQDAAVDLTWSMPSQVLDKSNPSQYLFSIQRAEIKWENRSCTDCPTPNMQEVARFDPGHPKGGKMMGNQATWRDTSISPFHAYRYQIGIMDEQGRSLVQSNPSNVKVVPAPAALKQCTANQSPQGILLQWKAVKRDIRGKMIKGDLQYIVERGGSDGKWEKLSPVAVKGTSFLDSALASDQSYSYRVTPVLLFEGSTILGESTELTAVKAPDALPPPPPATVWVIPSKGALEVQWTESEGRNSGYHVYRREGKEIIRLTSSPIKHPPFVDRSVKRNVAYGYAVSAVGGQPAQKEGLLSKWAETRSLSFE